MRKIVCSTSLVCGLSVTLKLRIYMQENPTIHVEPLTLWQCACGGLNLSKRDYQHVIACPECETLAVAISDALNDIEKAFGRRHIAAS
jgi:hypothetical protein